MSMTASETLAFSFSHAPEPRRESLGLPWKPPTYFWMRLIREAGTCRAALSANLRVKYSSLRPSLLMVCMPVNLAMPWATWTT
jgi:hypothetical protein